MADEKRRFKSAAMIIRCIRLALELWVLMPLSSQTLASSHDLLQPRKHCHGHARSKFSWIASGVYGERQPENREDEAVMKLGHGSTQTAFLCLVGASLWNPWIPRIYRICSISLIWRLRLHWHLPIFMERVAQKSPPNDDNRSKFERTLYTIHFLIFSNYLK